MEPEQLKKGKEFHKKIQSDWRRDIKDGILNIEHSINIIPKSSQTKHTRRGRLDMFVDELSDFISVIEIKSTDWDKIKPKNVRRLLGVHRRQIWKYINKYINEDKMDVCPGIIYPKVPKSTELRDTIEKNLNGYGIQVVWYFD